MPGREAFLYRLQAVLKPQLEEFPDVKVSVRVSNESMDLGANRQVLLDAAVGEYVNFIDDDDLVPADYIKTIYPLLDGVDYIGFRLQLYNDGEKQLPTFHSLRYPVWNADAEGYYRDISHLNPMRRELAQRVKMEGWAGEDARWADGLRALGIVKTEHFVNAIMYMYYWRSNKKELPRRWGTQGPQQQHHHSVPLQLAKCPQCGSGAVCMAGGMRHCNQCGSSWT
jgi:hypothetical protein